MSKEKFNIEEVFKSELEDFEMNIPKNGWSNISNQLGNAAKVGKAVSFSTASIIIATTSIAIAVGAITYAIKNSAEEKKITQTELNTIKNTTTPQSITNFKKEVNSTVKNETSTLKKVNLEKAENSIIDPVIEKDKIEHKTKQDTYILKQSNTTLIEDQKIFEPTNQPLIITKKPTKPLSEATKQPKEIEVITIAPTKIIASISATPIGGPAPLTVEFSHPNENISSIWDFKDGAKSRAQQTSHTFNQPGEYSVELTLKNENGTEQKVTKNISVAATSKINLIPNIFTPNNDGINDSFKVRYENMEVFKLYIYDKSGTLIFESNDERESWNGKTKFNTEAKADSYIYIIKAKGNDGKKYEENGMIKLAR